MYINLDVLNITHGNTDMIDTEFGRMHIERIEAGKLKVISGKVIATDPILLYDDESYSETIKPGTYPVYIYYGKTEKRKKQSIIAELKLSDNEPVKWEMALYAGESSSGFAFDEFMGYEVENGLGCFMDEKVMRILDVMDENELEKYEKKVKNVVRESDNSCVEVVLDETNGANIIIFASGWNNGVFPTYYGFDKNNKLTRLVTDFMVVEL
ncbi:DUF4241 domain-containing protein [Sedimentibacter sp. MB31-C6]|uniref:DUF4241 domain-containing protein n=1 Tax=Sedimentibacter sp. MB31-C6 TaxID=3109366 RepID=UPI002DDD20C1|nr:DUF4241 domain-containing protein [Sedimentibacter sp. MB36-C1]WSI04390.1 DUF4241 domain-containing protein [Sedimentibacter sp. MB36-C1]